MCVVIQWHAIAVPSTKLFQDTGQEEDSDLETTHTLSESNEDFLIRSLTNSQYPRNPQLTMPPLFVPWQEVVKQLDIPLEQETPSEDLRTLFQKAIGILPTEEQRAFHQMQGLAFSQIPPLQAPVETVALILLGSMYETHFWVPYSSATLVFSWTVGRFAIPNARQVWQAHTYSCRLNRQQLPPQPTQESDTWYSTMGPPAASRPRLQGPPCRQIQGS